MQQGRLEHHERQHDEHAQYELHEQRGNHEREDHHQQSLENPQWLRDPERLVRRRGREPPTPTAESLNGHGDHQHGGWQLHHSSTGIPFYFNRTTGESVWARGNIGASGGTSLGGVGRGRDSAATPSRSAYKRSRLSSSSSASGSLGLPSAAGSSEHRSSSSNSSDTLSTSSASNSSHGGSYTSDSDARGSHDVGSTPSSSSSTSSESSDESSSSDGSWTASMEIRFRRMITSEEGRKMLAMEVGALNMRQAGRRARPQYSSTGVSEARRTGGSSSYSQRERQLGEEDDVEMALLKPNSEGGLSGRRSSRGRGSSGGSSDDADTRGTGSSFSLRLSSDSDGASDLSLLTSDVVLERLEKVERVLSVARGAAVSVLRASCGFGRYASVTLWTAAWRGALRARRLLFSGRASPFTSAAPPSSPSFSPAVI